ncbi:MAG: TonB-dependent receptor [Colwellia sp.]|nr:TonB-dependent receptor [Colwellia sp.]MCW9082441.1 TonB-dependent receptor [Colwellia sp.]
MLIRKAPSVATVITAKQIESMGAKTVSEALENVPGLHVYPSPFNRLNSSFSIRGIHTDQNPQILFLIDGLPVREEYTGARPQAFKMPVHSISRIEVIRGPGSAVYGADAYAGVINVITKDLTEIQSATYGASYGSFNSSNLWYQNAFKLGNAEFGLAIETLKSDGDEDRILTRDLQSIFDDVLGTSASKAPEALNTNYDIIDIRLTGAFNNIESNFWYWDNHNAGVGAGAGQALDPTGTQNTTIYQFDLNYDWNISTWEASAQYSFYKMKDRAKFSVLPENALLPIGADGNLNLVAPIGMGLFIDGFLGNPQPTEKLNSFDFTLLSTDLNEHKLRFGAGISQRKLTANEEKNFGPGVIDTEKMAELFAMGQVMVIDGTLTDVTNTPYIFVKDVDRENAYISIQDQWQFANDWELTTGIRYDYYDDFGSTINPRMALVWEVNQSTTTKLLYGRAFRAPAFDTLYAINNPVGIGNPNLDPETIDTIEFSLNQHLQNNIHWSMNMFRYESKNLIEFVADPGATTTTAQNAKDQQGYGFETEFSWKYNNHSLALNYSWQNSEDKDSKVTTPLAPEQLFSAIYETNFSEQIAFNTKLNWIGKRNREIEDSRKMLDNYATVDMALHWSIDNAGSWKLSLLGKNIFDEKAFDPTHPLVSEALGPIGDYPIQGRSVYLQIAKGI